MVTTIYKQPTFSVKETVANKEKSKIVLLLYQTKFTVKNKKDVF
jgi:hypothetical protein